MFHAWKIVVLFFKKRFTFVFSVQNVPIQVISLIHHSILMRQSIIYEVTINYIGSLSEVRKREPFMVYFSNLKRAIECVQSNLALNGWEQKKVNYTAVYRTLKIKHKFICDFDTMKVKFFQVIISKKTLNPLLTTLGIDEFPTLKKWNFFFTLYN